MKNKTVILEWLITGVIVGLPFLYLAASWSSLPARVPTHFNLRGQADGYSERASLWKILVFLAVLSTGLFLLLRFLPVIDPKKKAALSTAIFRKTAMAVVILIAALNVGIVYGAQPGVQSVNQPVYIVLGIFFMYMGNLMNSIKPNYFVGIRLPWTLESEENWRATHRLGGRVFLAGGAVLILSALLLPIVAAGIILMIISALMALIPCCYSFIHFRRHRKNLLSILILILMMSVRSSAQFAGEAIGGWIGRIPQPGHVLTLYLHITGDTAGHYSGDWSSLEQHALGLKFQSIQVAGDSIHIITAMAPARFRGRFYSADSISGVWEQGGSSIPLGLTKTRRPQTPRSPFPYRSDSVEYEGDGGVHLGATLTLPAGAGRKKFPVVILITGSGLQDRDETIFDHRPFAVIADYLTRRGIAVLRADDRGIGRSHGGPADPTSYDYAGDVLAGIRYLRQRPEIDTTRIGLIGHSEGGLIAPIVYSRWPHLKTLILLAGPGVAGWQIILRQQTDPVRTLGPGVFDAYYSLVREKLQILNNTLGQPDSVTLQQLKALFAGWKAGLADSIATPLRVQAVSPELFASQEKAELKPWLRYFYATDPAAFLTQVKCPVLALNGEKDTQVDPRQNIPAIKNALKGSGARADTVVLPGLNHLFQHCKTGELAEYPVLEESFAPEALKAIGDWTTKFLTL